MFPDNNHSVQTPKFFSLTLTDEIGNHRYLYNLKFSEKYILSDENITTVPLVISICSNKEDFQPFKELLFAIHELITTEKNIEKDTKGNMVNNYKKIILYSLFISCFSLYKPPPHTTLSLKLIDIFDSQFNDLDFYFSSNCEIPCNKNDEDIEMLFSILDLTIIVKTLFLILAEKQIVIRASQSYTLHLVFPALLKLIFPFQWFHSYIPVLPQDNLELLEKPGPFLFGILSSSLSISALLKDYPSIVVVDCDSNEIIDHEFYTPPKMGKGLAQGMNHVLISKYRMKIVKSEEKEEDKKKIKKEEYNKVLDENIYVDCSGYLYKEKTASFISPEELKHIRKNMQILKNPYQIEEILKEKESLLKEKSFSSNIQNVFLDLYMNKMQLDESEFMKMFKLTNLYANYKEIYKYQSDSGEKIQRNIEITKNNPRSYENSMNIKYTMNEFPTNKFMDIIENEKEKENNKDNEKIKKVLNDYIKIRNILNGKISDTLRVTFNNFNRSSNYGLKNVNINTLQRHKTNQSFAKLFLNRGLIYEGTFSKNEFLFYSPNGFLKFMEDFNEFLDSHNLNGENEIFKENISRQVATILRQDQIIFPNTKTKDEPLDNKDEQSIKNEIPIKNDDNQFNTYTLIEPNLNEEEDTLEQNMKLEEDIIYCPLLTFYNIGIVNSNKNSLKAEIDNENPINKNNEKETDEKIDHALQYYLFFATFLEEIKEDTKTIDNFMKYLRKPITINELILRLYLRAYDSKNLYEYPYFQFYMFLNKLNITEMDSLNINENYSELSEIFSKIYSIKRTKSLTKSKKRNAFPQNKNQDNIEEDIHRDRHISKSIGLKKIKISPCKRPIEKDNKNNNNQNQNLLRHLGKLNIFEDFIIMDSNLLQLKQKIIINSQEDFPITFKPRSCNIIKELSHIIIQLLHSNNIDNKTQKEILEILNKAVKESSSLYELVGELREIKLDTLKTKNERISFWGNCFNFLVIFAIAYMNRFINTEKDWREFFRYVYYIIGIDKEEFSFYDMQYILFEKVLFFPEGYRPRIGLKKYLVSQGKKVEKDEVELTYLFLSIPTKDFDIPTILTEDLCNCEITKVTTVYLLKNIYFNEENKLVIPKFILHLYPKFPKKIEVFKDCLVKDIAERIIKKKYSGKEIREYNWELFFNVSN